MTLTLHRALNGDSTDMKWAEITLRVPQSCVEPAATVLTEVGCAGVVIHDPNALSSDRYAEQRTTPTGEPCTVSGYLPVDDRLETAIDDLQDRMDVLRDAGLPVEDEILLRTVDDESWAEAWKAYFKPLRVGQRFVVKPSWEPWDAAPEDLIIEIDPGMAFGSGAHPTTRLCLQLLEETMRPGERILDWGTGSGILAIGAARLGAREIVAVDLDPVAVRTAAENAARNGFEDVIHTSESSIEAVPADPPFDRVIANIVANPIIDGAAEIYQHLRPGGTALISGIIETRDAEVIEALQAAGLLLEEVRHEEDWTALRFTKPD